MRLRNIISGIIIPILLLAIPERGADSGTPDDRVSCKIAPSLLKVITQGNSGARTSVWAFFKDKGITGPEEYRRRIRAFRKAVPERVLSRRKKTMRGDIFRKEDLPVYGPYVGAISETGAKIRTISRWFNGVSVEADAAQILKLGEFPFVKSVEPVAKFRSGRISPAEPTGRTRLRKGVGGADIIDYGQSRDQLESIGVPEMHGLGFDGSGIRICILDAGFSYKEIDLFSHLKVIAERDFVDNDDDTSPGSHGTKVLSVIAGFEEGSLVGPAYNSEYLLARTEDVSVTDAPIEEDYWIAGAEWADSLGADIINSSLGYSTWAEGEGEDYTYSDLDGNTARITIAADMASERGIVVVNSAGNEGTYLWRYITFPADGDSVIAVGAWDLQAGLVANSSSRGPTADGRIKPDFVAPGVNVIVTRVGKEGGVTIGSGTSFAAPLISGAAALLLQSHPDWTPMQLREAFRISATKTLDPDNDVGWGLVSLAAANSAENAIYGRIVEAEGSEPVSTARIYISSGSFSDSAYVSQSGRFLFRDLAPGVYSLRAKAPRHGSYFSAEWIEVPTSFEEKVVKMEPAIIPTSIYLYPNPYRMGAEGMKIYFPEGLYGEAEVRIFTTSGELVASIGRMAGEREIRWYGRNFNGKEVGSGVYIYTVEGDSFRTSGKLAVIR